MLRSRTRGSRYTLGVAPDRHPDHAQVATGWIRPEWSPGPAAIPNPQHRDPRGDLREMMYADVE